MRVFLARDLVLVCVRFGVCDWNGGWTCKQRFGVFSHTPGQHITEPASHLQSTNKPKVLIPEAISALEEREAALSAVDLLRGELDDKEASLLRAQQQQAGHQPGSPGAAGVDRKATQLMGSVLQLQVGFRFSLLQHRSYRLDCPAAALLSDMLYPSLSSDHHAWRTRSPGADRI